jgi:pimeloyl-ACP methyl ester carboxylesterase
MCWTKAILCSLFAALAAGDDTFFLKPAAGKSGEEIAVVIIQGASCPPGGYQPLGEAIQAASPFPVWIGVPEYIQDIPEPAQFGSKLDDVLGRMATAGMTTNRTIIAAHSLGGVMSQIYLTSLGGHAEALVLMGATVLRSNRDYDFPFPILTIDGELDGLLHVTRQAEAYYHQVSKAGGPSAAVSNPTGQPVVLLDGLNHWSFSSGTPPSNVASHDLKAEVTEEQGHAVAAAAISNWVTMRLAPAGAAAHTAAAAALTAAVTKTGEFLGPITQVPPLTQCADHPSCIITHPATC